MARVSQDYLRSVTTLPWPARSPDLSLIEHIWDNVGRRVGHPMSLNELEQRYSTCGMWDACGPPCLFKWPGHGSLL
ncbi:transposable element Tcb2 transposase [Trichonephila clavipes]|uniref:Transposable element Tcb2 transposase n=1 Tax=Trichonephila clavipes TaxID=2585209 RepID=A0A8X6R5S2_TRICX|nr:transposable element Tcb2 transposase [Trichonephila clavipes]